LHYYRASWQEMIASLPPAEQLELLGVLAEPREDDTPAEDTAT